MAIFCSSAFAPLMYWNSREKLPSSPCEGSGMEVVAIIRSDTHGLQTGDRTRRLRTWQIHRHLDSSLSRPRSQR